MVQRYTMEDAARQVRDDAPRQPDVDAEAIATGGPDRAPRARAERSVNGAAESQRLRQELDHLRGHARALGPELAAAEVQLREQGGVDAETLNALPPRLKDRRILYVGGRLASFAAAVSDVDDTVPALASDAGHHSRGRSNVLMPDEQSHAVGTGCFRGSPDRKELTAR